MNGIDQLKQQWEELGAEQRKALIGIGIAHALLVLVGFRSLAKTPDERLRGPRWVWKLVMPSSTIKIADDDIIFAPTGVVAFFLIGKRWGKQRVAEE